MSYRLAPIGVIRLSDGLLVTRAMPGEWQAYRAWLKAGNTPEPMAAPATPALSVDEIKARLLQAVQDHLDAAARVRGYDGILSACTYATDPNPTFSAEGQCCVVWRGAVWQRCSEVLAEVTAGTRPVPSAPDLIALLPPMAWPA